MYDGYPLQTEHKASEPEEVRGYARWRLVWQLQEVLLYVPTQSGVRNVSANAGYLDNCMKFAAPYRGGRLLQGLQKNIRQRSNRNPRGFKFLKQTFPRLEQFDPARERFLDYLKSSQLC